MRQRVKSESLGPLEIAVLGTLGPTPLPVADVQQRLQGRGQDLAYTTVMTVLVRLAAKGWVMRKKNGRHFVYSRGQGVEQRRESFLAKVKKALFAGDRLAPIVALLGDEGDLSQEELLKLRRLVDARLREQTERLP